MKNKKMLWIVLVVVLIVVAGGAAYWFTRKDTTNNSTGGTDGSSQVSKTSGTETQNFNPVSMQGQSFVATISGTQNGKALNATMSYDGKSSYSYEVTQDGQKVQMIVTSDAFYTCNNGNCYKTAVNANSKQSFDPSNYQYSASDIDSFKNSAAYKGTQSCAGGTCDVWEVSDSKTGKTTLFLDSNSHRIVEVSYSENGNTFKISYAYKPVTITPPANAKSLQTP